MTSPSTLLKAWNLRARKELGQNFLKDVSLAEKIVDLIDIDTNDAVLEIGAGLGMMTIAAAHKTNYMIAIEKDRHLVPILRSELLAQGLDHVEVVDKNIMAVNLRDVSHKAGRPLTVIGNLPYNISSQVLVKLIHERSAVKRAALMFQKELADRLCAGPGNKSYGRLSVLLQYCADIHVLRDIRADMFFPKPKVDSTVIGITFKNNIAPQVVDEALFAKVIQAAFGKRRKTLRNALAGSILQLDSNDSLAALTQAGIDPQRRAETLSVHEFVSLTDVIAELKAK